MVSEIDAFKQTDGWTDGQTDRRTWPIFNGLIMGSMGIKNKWAATVEHAVFPKMLKSTMFFYYVLKVPYRLNSIWIPSLFLKVCTSLGAGNLTYLILLIIVNTQSYT